MIHDVTGSITSDRFDLRFSTSSTTSAMAKILKVIVVAVALFSNTCAAGVWGLRSPGSPTRQDHVAKKLSVEGKCTKVSLYSTYTDGAAEIGTMNFDLSLLRPQDIPDSEIIGKALEAIESLNTKKLCHRLSASMLLENCRTTYDFDSLKSYAKESDAEQERRDGYLKIFAIALTMCDIEEFIKPVPLECEPYGQTALMGIKESGMSTSIRVNDAERSGCMKAIDGQGDGYLYKANQQSASVMCQVTRMDFEKDESIALFARLTRLMRDVVDEVHKLSKLNQENYRQATAAKEAATEVRSSVEKLKTGLSDIWIGISAEAVKAQGNAKQAFASMTNFASEFETLLNRLKKGTLETHAEHAIVHQRAYDATNDLATRTHETRQEMVELKDMMLQLYSNMNAMGHGLVALQERQTAVDKQSQQVLQVLVNMTEQVQAAHIAGEDHTILLSKATQAATSLLETIEKAESGATTWQKKMLSGSGPFGVGWALFILTPLATVMIGSYHRKPTILQTIGLTILGVPLAILISMSCSLRWQDLEFLMRRPTFTESATEQIFDA